MIKQDLRPYADCYNVESVYYSGSDAETYPEVDVDTFLNDDDVDTQVDINADLFGDEYADFILSTISHT